MKMADLTIREKFFDDLAKGARWDVGVSIARGNPLPLDANSVFESYADLETYAAGVLAYPGQVVAVVNADSTGIYYLDQEKAIKPVGVIPAGDELSVDMDDNDVISLHNFGKVFYKYVAENGDVAAHYEKVNVSDANPWTAGLEPRVVTEDGKLVLGWYEPNPTTIDGVNDQVTAVQGTVSDLVNSVGAPSTENSEATGLYKEVEDVQEDVKELTDAVGSSEDALGDDVQTLWAHVNDHTGRLEELEAIDHDAFATKVELAAEADRADKAEKANAAAIKVIADDYLKAADIANMATDAEVEAAVKVEADRAKGVEESLQTQINAILNNPDAEGAINSINEFTKYIEDHGEIADGFRTDINKNKDDIAAEVERATGAESALSGRLDVLEAIDHDAYIAADTALKAELEAEIEKKADAATVANDIATAKQAAIDAAAADATTKANAAKDAAIADAATKYATTGALSDLETALDERLDALEAFDHDTYATKEALNGVKTTADNASTAVSNLETRFDEIVAVGGEPNAINKIQVNGSELAIENKTVNIAVPTKFSDITDDSGFDARITAAKTQADKGVTDAAAADAKAVKNAEDIGKHETRISALETAKGDHETRITELEAADVKHAAEYEALNNIVTGHTEAIAQKADTTTVNGVVAKAAANEAAIATLNTTTIPGINTEIAKKADADALANYYTKTEIGAITGEVANDKTLVQMIADAQAAATYDDTEVRQLITNEAARADAAEKANAKEIARVNEVLVAALDNNEEGLDSIKELATWITTHGTAASEMSAAITANADAIAAINHETTGILALAKAHADTAVANIPAATAEALGLVKFDNDTIKMNENNQLYAAKVSTDILVQGAQTLILNGGSATA
jgi:hypothetical protein